MKRVVISLERIVELKNKLEMFSPRSAERKKIIADFAELYGVSIHTVYRRINEISKPKSMKRSDYGKTRYLEKDEMERYCQIIAALKVRTMNKKGHHLSTPESIRILEEVGVEVSGKLIKAPKGVLKKSTVNRFITRLGYDKINMSFQQVATRFQASNSNDCWHFDLSPSDLKEIDEWPEWIDPQKGKPVLMLYGVVDDRSGVSYQEYHVVYGEDVEAALRFFFRAMSPKDIDGFPLEGIPKMIYTDNGPISKSGVFKRVMDYLGIEVKYHLPKGKDKRRTTARSKGKIERPFRTIKEVHETLYHFHKPKNEEQANEWLSNYILQYNVKPHRSENHSRIEDWIQNIPKSGIKKMCSWERFCTFAREPERRKVGTDAKLSLHGTVYDVAPELANQRVVVWWGLFDEQIFIEFDSKKYGPFSPTSGPIPLHKYRSYKRAPSEERKEEIEKLAREINIPLDILTVDFRNRDELLRAIPEDTRFITFDDPDPFNEIEFPNIVTAKREISSFIGTPLAKLPEEQLNIINEFLDKSLNKKEVFEMIRENILYKKTSES